MEYNLFKNRGLEIHVEMHMLLRFPINDLWNYLKQIILMYSKNTKILSSFKTIVCQLIKVRYIQKIQKKLSSLKSMVCQLSKVR